MAKLIELNPAALPIDVLASPEVIRHIRKSRKTMNRLNLASSLCAAGERSPLIFAAFDTVRAVYPTLDGPARRDALALVQAWGFSRGAPLLKYAQSAWAPYKRATVLGEAEGAEWRGMSRLFRDYKAGTGKHGSTKQGQI